MGQSTHAIPMARQKIGVDILLTVRDESLQRIKIQLVNAKLCVLDAGNYPLFSSNYR